MNTLGPRSWREWFVSPSEDIPSHQQNDEADFESGARHKDSKKLSLKKRRAPKCAGCKRFMGYNDGMYIIISAGWRVHIKCFSDVVEKHFEDGEVIDLTTGQIINVEQRDDSS